MRVVARFVAGIVLAATVPALAHHSFAMFDNTKTMTIEGTVREFQWTNPHSWIQVIVPDESGKPVEWSIGAGSPVGLIRQGWKRYMLKPGDKVVVTFHPLKDGSIGGELVSVSVNGAIYTDR